MLVWINAVLHGRNITNLSTDWSNGENLVALVNFCKPALIGPDESRNHPHERLSYAMQVAQKVLGVPQVLSPDDLFVDQPDEVSVMTYLSFFCRINSPGERALLQWVQQVIPDEKITNFTSDWVSGVNLGALVNKLTRNGLPQFKNYNPNTPLTNCQESMKKAEDLLKIPASVSAESLSSDDLAYLPKLAYLVQFYAANQGEPVTLKVDVSKIQVSPINRGEEMGIRVLWMDLDCSNAGHANIQANIATGAGKAIDASVTEIQEGTEQYHIKFPIAAGVDVYTVSIRYDGEEMNGSPFHVNLAAADATKVHHMGTNAQTDRKESDPVVLGFDTKEAGYGKLIAEASGECAGSVPVQLVQKPKGGFDVVFTPPIPDVYSIDILWGKFMALAKGESCGTVPIELLQDSKKDFKLSFEPPTPDVYTVDVTWGGEPVPGSPFTINLLPPEKSEKVETGDAIFGGVGEMVDFPVDLTYAGSGVLTATCRGEKVGDVETSILSISRKLYQVTFLASQIDIYYLTIFFNAVQIPGSPFRINLTQKVRGTHIPQPAYHREIGSPMTVEVPSEKNAKLSVTAFGEVTGSWGTVIKKNSRGNFDVTLDPTTPDIYTVEVQLNDKRIPECCFVIQYSPCVIPRPEKCRFAVDINELCRRFFDIDSDVHFTIDTSDAGKSALEISVVSPDQKQHEIEVKPREEDETMLDISYVPKVVGTHYIKLLWDRKDIPQSPLKIRVVDFAGVQNFAHSKSVSVDIKIPSDTKEKDVKVTVIHVTSGSISKSGGRYSKGKYQVTFSSKLSGLYSITVLIKGRELPTSPYVIRYGDPPRPQQCVIKDYPENVYVGRSVTFTVDASNCGSGELNLKTTACKLLKKSKVTWKENTGQRGVYVVSFSPATVGPHQLLITWAGVPIPGTPHNIVALDKPRKDLTKPTAEMFTMDLTSKIKTRVRVDPIPEIANCYIGQALLLQVTMISKHDGLLTHIGKGLRAMIRNEVQATAVGEKTGSTDVQVKKVHGDAYDIVFAPTESDRYVLSIQYEDQDILSSPITAVFDHAPSDPTKVEPIGIGELNFFIHQEVKFEINTTGAGVGPLAVWAQAPGIEGKTPVNVKQEENHRYSIRYLPLTTGRHLLHLLWGGTAIPNSPVTIEVKELSIIPPDQPASYEMAVAKWKLSDIDSIGTHLDTGRNYVVKRKQKKGKYIFTLQPDEPGKYEIALRVEGRDICRPFLFRFDRPSQPDKVVVYNFKGEGVVVNEKIKFKIDVSDAGIGPLKINTDGPGKAETSISACEDGIYTIHFSASSPGRYRLKITWNGEEIKNSPFDIVLNARHGKKRKRDKHQRLSWPSWGWKKEGSPSSGDSEDSEDELDTGYNWQWIIGRDDEKDSPPKTNPDGAEEKVTDDLKQSTEVVNINIGRPSRWEIDISELDGHLEVTAVGEKSGVVDVLLTQIRERVFQATFAPINPDIYTISVLLNGKHMPNSPIVINYTLPPTDVTKIRIVGLKKLPSLVAVGQKISVFVNTQDAGLGELKVNAKSLQSKGKSGTLEIENYDDNPAIYEVSYTPEIVGVHLLELLFSQIAVPGSPLQLQVCDPRQVSYSYETLSSLNVGQLIRMQCDTSKAGNNDLTATCVGTVSGEIVVSVSPTKDKGKYDISFKPNVEDIYILSVMLGPYHVKDSPFKFNLSAIEIEKTIVSGPLQPEGPRGPVKLVINTADLPRGKLVSICKYKEETVSVKVKETSPNVFTLGFQPVEAGRYVWSVTFHGQHIPGSPFIFDTTPRPEKTAVVIPEPGSVGIGQYMYYEINVSGAGMGTLTATCTGEKSKKILVEVTQIQPSVFTVSFLLLSYDKYSFYVQWSGKELPNSPFVYDLRPPKRRAGKKPLEIPLLLPPISDISTVDVTCRGVKYGTIAVKLTPVSENKYRVSFKPQGPDLYTLNVLHNGLHVKGSPFLLDLRVPEDTSAEETDGDVTIHWDESNPAIKSREYKVVIGSALIVNVRPQRKDQKGGNAIVATAVGKQTGLVPIDVEKFSEEYLRISFNPKKRDTYTITISVSGVPQSPLIAHYYDPPSRPSNVEIIGLDDIMSVLEVNQEVSAVINAKRAGNGTLRAEVRGPNNPKVELRQRDGELGMYTISFTPTATGVYTLSLFWNDEHVSNSPLKIRVVDSSTAKRYFPGKIISTDDLEIQCGPTDIIAYALGRESTTKLKVAIKQVKKHLYRFSFSHNEPGFYYIHIFIHGVELDVSPIPVYISVPPQPDKCVVHNLPSVTFVGEEIRMVIDCTEGGEGSLEARLVGPKKLETVLSVVDNHDGTYTIKYVPTTEGTYSFHITWSGKYIYKIPYQVTVKKQTQEELPVSEVCIVDLANQSHPVTGGEEITIAMDHYFAFGIRLTKKQERNFHARAISKAREYDISLTQEVDNLFKCTFKPPSPGKYVLEFCLGDLKLKLPQLPRRLNVIEAVVDTSKVQILKHTIAGLVLVKREIFFQIDAKLAGNGTIKAKLDGPSPEAANLRIVPTKDKPYICDVSFTPAVAGVYHLVLLWNDTVIPGFPLVLDVITPNIKHSESSSIEIPINSRVKDIAAYAVHVKTGNKLDVEIHQVSKRRYRFDFYPKLSGAYNLHVFVGPEEITGSPFTFIYCQPSQSWNVIVTNNIDNNVQVDSVVKLGINALKAGDGDLNIVIRGPDSEDEPKLKLTELSSGIYEAKFTPSAIGVYTVRITWSGEDVPNSPFQANVIERGGGLADAFKDWISKILDDDIPEPVDEKAVCVDDNATIPSDDLLPPSFVEPQPSIDESVLNIFRKVHIWGKRVSFSIVHNGFPGSLTIRCKGRTDISIKTIKGSSSNTFEINPKVPGRYELVLLWNGHVMGGGPYILQFDMPRTISGFNWQDQVFQVGKSYQCTINTNDISLGVMEISCEPRDAAKISITAVTSSKYECFLYPKRVGNFKISVSYNGFQIQGSPFLVHFTASSASNVKFNLQAEGIEIDDISATLKSVATQQQIPVSLEELFGGECNLEFAPTDGDEYTLTITCGLKMKRESIAGSPYNLTYLPLEENASRCCIEGADGLSVGALGEWSKFVVNCEGAGPGKLTAEFNVESAEVRVVSVSEYTYEVQHCISTAGEYQLQVQWGGQDIPGSPFQMSVASTTTSQLSVSLSSIPTEVKATEPIEFNIEIQAGGNEGDLTVQATTSSGNKVNGSLSLAEGGYRVSIPTREPGEYSITTYKRGVPLLQQPLKVRVGESLQIIIVIFYVL